MKPKFNRKNFAIVLISTMAILSGVYLIAADHIDAPAVTGKGSDITDVYAFQSPATSSNMVFVVNVQGLLAPSATAAASFDPEVMVEINIDNSATKDNVEDLVIQATFENGKVQLYGPIAPIQTGLNSTLVTSGGYIEGSVTAYKGSVAVGEKNGIKVFAGPRDDPFFFDLEAYSAVIGGTASGFNNPGNDTFKGTNVLSLVVEVPKSMLGTGSVNVWATSNRRK